MRAAVAVGWCAHHSAHGHGLHDSGDVWSRAVGRMCSSDRDKRNVREQRGKGERNIAVTRAFGPSRNVPMGAQPWPPGPRGRSGRRPRVVGVCRTRNAAARERRARSGGESSRAVCYSQADHCSSRNVWVACWKSESASELSWAAAEATDGRDVHRVQISFEKAVEGTTIRQCAPVGVGRRRTSPRDANDTEKVVSPESRKEPTQRGRECVE